MRTLLWLPLLHHTPNPPIHPPDHPQTLIHCCRICAAAAPQGAEADLQVVVGLCPPKEQQQYNDELSALQRAAAARAQQAWVAAELTRQEKKPTVTKSCTIEEVEEDPMEEQQVGGWVGLGG